jgi:uncharacterized membrane protein YphA (DoxX/SURF4 family)
MFVLVRIILGLLFIVSGAEKVISPAENFFYVIEGYDVLPLWLARIVSVTFPWIELLVGLFIALGLWLRPAFYGLLLISASFIGIVGQAIIRKLPIENCGCFGNLIHLPLQGVIILDSTIFAVTLLCLFNFHKAGRFGLDMLYESDLQELKDRSVRKGKKG